jgi:outer membrane protein TolC
MKRPGFLLLCAVLAGSAGTSAVARDALTLREAVQAALASNLEVRIASLEPEIARQSVTVEEAAFDTRLFAEGSVAQSEQTTTFSATTGTSADRRSWVAGAQKRFALGTSVTVQTSLDRNDSNAGVNTSNLSQSADLTLLVRQPLLRGFGRDANLASLQQSEAGFEAAKAAFRKALLEVLAEAERAYWNVARLQEELALNDSALSVAEALLNESRERRRVGLATEVDVLQAEAFQAEQLEARIETNRRLGEAVDALLSITGRFQEDTPPGIDYEPSLEPLQIDTLFEPEFRRILEEARAIDPDLAAQASRLDQRQWAVREAKANLKPSLDLVLSGAYLGLDDEDAGTAYNNAFDRDGNAWSAGLEFSMPWQQRAAKATLRQREKQFEQEEIRYLQREQELFRNVRAAWRSLESTRQSLEASRLTVRLQEAAFEQEKGKFEEGLSVFRDVLESQRDLDQAQSRLLQAKFNRISAEIEIQRLSGKLFERHNLSTVEIVP